MRLSNLPRLVRLQFTPIMIAPIVLGTAIAWWANGEFSPLLFALVLLGAVCLHLAANAIDDVYDYINGTDEIAERLFPPDAPGWKPIPRGGMSVSEAFGVSYLLYGASALVGVYLAFIVGWYVLAIAVPGILLSYFYTAPPLKLDYRGLGLGEVSILLSFGPIPCLGAFYVMTGQVSALPVLASIPTGLFTTAILMSHDMIYFDVYKEAGKKSATVVLGRLAAARVSTALASVAYLGLAAAIALGALPVTSGAAFAALPLFVKFADVGRKEHSPPEYGSRTMLAFVQSTLFTLLLAVGILLG